MFTILYLELMDVGITLLVYLFCFSSVEFRKIEKNWSWRLSSYLLMILSIHMYCLLCLRQVLLLNLIDISVKILPLVKK